MRSSTKPRRVVVIGAGIAGAAAAWELRQRLPDAELLVLEATDRVGGKLHRIEFAGATFDVGAEAMLARRPEALDLVNQVGLGHRVIHPQATQSALWTRGALRPMPPTVMGVPADPAALAQSGVLSEPAQRRVAEAPLVAEPDADVSVGDFVADALGDEVCDRLLEPLLGGVYAGHARALSLFAAAPQIAALADGTETLTAAAARTLAQRPADPGPVFAGLVGGVAALVPATLAAAGATVRLRSTVRELRRRVRGWQVLVGPTTDEELIDADAVVLATPGAATSRLLGSHAPTAADELGAIEYASMAVVSLAIPRTQLALPDGSGFLVPPVDGRFVKAVTLSSSKWAWVDQHTDDELVVLRGSIGRAGEVAVLQRSDTELIGGVVEDLRDAIGMRGEPAHAHVQRWGGGLPQYAVGHLDRVRRIEDSVAAVDGIEVCGAAYHGIGIPAVIGTARTAAERAAAWVRESRAVEDNESRVSTSAKVNP